MGLFWKIDFRGMLLIVARWSEIFEVRIAANTSLGSKDDFIKIWSINEALNLAKRVGFVIEGKYPLFRKFSKYSLKTLRSLIFKRSILKSPQIITLLFVSNVSR